MTHIALKLAHEWTIFVQPFLNGLRPDNIVFSELRDLAFLKLKIGT